jgi:hypothetical protein
MWFDEFEIEIGDSIKRETAITRQALIIPLPVMPSL